MGGFRGTGLLIALAQNTCPAYGMISQATVPRLKKGYRRDYWKDQPEHVEVWLEKDSVAGSLEPVTKELGVRMRAARGFNSTTRVREVAQHLCTIHKPKFIYYLGDHDPSGDDMDRDLSNRVLKECYKIVGLGINYFGEFEDFDLELSGLPAVPGTDHNVKLTADAVFRFQRLAIFKEDIDTYNLPPLKIKRDEAGEPTDSRSASFLAKHGDVCVELDALPPEVLRKRVRDAIESKIDKAKWDQALLVEKAELASISDFVSKMKFQS
jgi:hypothetical protein